MRSKAMTKMTGCATGALLFGGTLGATQHASAGIVWKDGCSYLTQVYNYETYLYETGTVTIGNELGLAVQGPRNYNGNAVGNLISGWTYTGAAVGNAQSMSINPVWGAMPTFSVSKTATTASGFSASMEYASTSGAGWSSFARVAVTQAFEVSAGTSADILLTLNAPNMKAPGDYSNFRSISLKKVMGVPGYEYLEDIIGIGTEIPVDMASSQTLLNLSEGRYLFEVMYQMGDDSSHTGTLVDFAIVPAPGAIALLGVAGLMGRRRRN